MVTPSGIRLSIGVFMCWALLITQEETFTGGLCRVGTEPKRHYILWERLAVARDQDTWNELMGPGVSSVRGFNRRAMQHRDCRPRVWAMLKFQCGRAKWGLTARAVGGVCGMGETPPSPLRENRQDSLSYASGNEQREDRDHRREIDGAGQRRHHASNRLDNRRAEQGQELHHRIQRIGIDPAE